MTKLIVHCKLFVMLLEHDFLAFLAATTETMRVCLLSTPHTWLPASVTNLTALSILWVWQGISGCSEFLYLTLLFLIQNLWLKSFTALQSMMSHHEPATQSRGFILIFLIFLRTLVLGTFTGLDLAALMMLTAFVQRICFSNSNILHRFVAEG